jgi:hypothetical protein
MLGPATMFSELWKPVIIPRIEAYAAHGARKPQPKRRLLVSVNIRPLDGEDGRLVEAINISQMMLSGTAPKPVLFETLRNNQVRLAAQYEPFKAAMDGAVLETSPGIPCPRVNHKRTRLSRKFLTFGAFPFSSSVKPSFLRRSA